MNWSWLIVLWGLLRDIFTGPRPKSRIRLEVKGEDVIAQERKHLEELNAEVRRIKSEIKKLAPQATAAIMAHNRARVKFLDREFKRLRTERRTAEQRRDDYERLTSSGW